MIREDTLYSFIFIHVYLIVRLFLRVCNYFFNKKSSVKVHKKGNIESSVDRNYGPVIIWTKSSSQSDLLIIGWRLTKAAISYSSQTSSLISFTFCICLYCLSLPKTKWASTFVQYLQIEYLKQFNSISIQAWFTRSSAMTYVTFERVNYSWRADYW